jgi:DNA-directed RNA polymerase subunit beta'
VKFGDIEEGVTISGASTRSRVCRGRSSSSPRRRDLRPRHRDQGSEDQSDAQAQRTRPRRALPACRRAPHRRQRRRRHRSRRHPRQDPRETSKTKDITGGLPRVAELFEARKPKDHAIITEIDGLVEFGKDTKGKRKVVITPPRWRADAPDQAREYLIPKGKHIQVQPGDRVRAGDPLMDGPPNPHDILRVKGEREAAWLVNEIQQVYRLQGVRINDKHIEVIVRQMLRRVRVKEVGDTNFLVDEQVEKHDLREENERVIARGGRPAIAEALLLGITKASLSTESFISASFQETTKVLTEAAINGQGGRSARPQGERHHGAAHPGRNRSPGVQTTQRPRRRRGRALDRGRARGAFVGSGRGSRCVDARASAASCGTSAEPETSSSSRRIGPPRHDTPPREHASRGGSSLDQGRRDGMGARVTITPSSASS